MRLAFIKCHGSGNDFPLIDARSLDVAEEDWPGIARALADREGPVGGDGLLLLVEGDERHAFGMRMFNSDGSEAETCLNGLRCVARAGLDALGLDRARVKLRTSSAEVAREPDLSPGVATIRTVAGPASTRTADVGLMVDAAQLIDVAIPGLPSRRAFTAIAIPNPHLIAFVEHIDEGELGALGDWCETAPSLLPRRANVSFVQILEQGDLFVRTYERGVGLTDSCGSAMASSVHAAALTGRVPFGREVRVFNKGGLVRASAEADSHVTVRGNATFLYDASIEVEPGTACASALRIGARRDDEAAAWDAAVREHA